MTSTIRNDPLQERGKVVSGRKILTACLAPCVHVAGTVNFGNIAALLGFETTFLGPAIKVNDIVHAIEEEQPDIVGLSYRLTPANLRPVLQEFFTAFDHVQHKPGRLLFAGTPEDVVVAKEFGRFEAYFEGGESTTQVIRVLQGDLAQEGPIEYPQDLLGRIRWKQHFPLLRAHFGLPTLESTLEGIREIAGAEVLDVISVADDQNTQENFFHPEMWNPNAIGAGGVPLRSQEDLLALHEARARGNHPLLRIYAGTRDFCQFAQVVQETIHNAWAAIPMFYFNRMDGRGPLSLEDSLVQHLEVIKWHADRGIPVEINDPHHWGLRDAPDAVCVADSYLCAKIVKALGVRYYVAQYMFNSPPSASIKMDLAKMLAMQELNTSLEDDSFTVFRQTRTGLASYPLNLHRAKGQLAIATTYQLALRPHIIHVVTHSEAQHAATPAEIAESCEIVNQVITRGFEGIPDPTKDPEVITRKNQLVNECRLTFHAIGAIARAVGLGKGEVPYLDPKVLSKIVISGLFDAPHLINNPYAHGVVRTKIVNGACVTWDPALGRVISEEERVNRVLDALGREFPEVPIIS